MRILQKKFVCLVVCAAFALGAAIQTGFAVPGNPASPQKSGAAVDLNSASEKDLEDLPGVGPATAKKIIAGRPYSSVDGLAKAGVSAATVKKITPLVTVGGGGAAASMPAPAAAPSKKPTSAARAKEMAPAAPAGGAVDLNSASEKDLVDLPGVGPATAKKIIAGRPYSSVDGLAKAGVSAATIKKITPLVSVSGGGAAASMPPSSPMPSRKSSSTTGYTGAPPASSSMPNAAPASQPAPAPAPAKSAPSAASQGTPGPGMVWVNLDSGVYHYPGTRYYGKTKSGKYLSESDAVKAGYHAAENEKKPQ